MATPAAKVIKMASVLPLEAARYKKDFDRAMIEIRFQNAHVDSREAAEYRFRELMQEVKSLARRFGFKEGMA